MVENACCIDCSDTWLSKQVDWLSKCKMTDPSTTDFRCKYTVAFDTEVAWMSLPIRKIHLQVVQASPIQWLPVSLHNPGWRDDCQVHNWSFKAIPILNSVNVEKAFSDSISDNHCQQWYVQSYEGWYASSCSEDESIGVRLILVVMFAWHMLSKNHAKVTPPTRCFWFQLISSILSECCNHVLGGAREWMSIQRMRSLILPNTARHF